MKRYPMIAFFVLMFVLSWGVWLPLASAIQNNPPIASASRWPAFFHVLGAFGPCFAAIIVTGRISGIKGLQQLFGRLLQWRAPIRWYVVALFLPAGILLLTSALHMMFGGEAPDFANPPVYNADLPKPLLEYNAWTILVPVFLLQLLTGSSLGEELGWRGFVLTRLQQRFSALDATLIISVIWAIWAQPLLHLQRMPAGHLLMAEDVRDMPALLTKLQRASDPTSRYLRSQLSLNLQSLLSEYHDAPVHRQAVRYHLLNELNEILLRGWVYDEEGFRDIAVSSETMALLRQKPQGYDRIRLNRELLELAYPAEIGKRMRFYLMPFIVLLIGVIPAQIIITWIFNSSGSSLLLVLLYNNALKTTDLFLTGPNAGQMIPVAAFWLVTLLIVSAVGTRTLKMGSVHTITKS